MRLLICEWSAFMQQDIEMTLDKMNIYYKGISYCFKDVNNDDYFEKQFDKYIKEDTYDAILTLNYFPLVAKVCKRNNIKYISWVYDCPFDVPDAEKTLGFSTNFIFFFDRSQFFYFKNLGFKTVYHMPLAVNIDRLEKIAINDSDLNRFTSEISFIGRLYNSDYDKLISFISDYDKGYLNGLIDSQLRIYGYNFIDEILNTDYLYSLQKQYTNSLSSLDLKSFKQIITYAINTKITQNERIELLSTLSENHVLKIYSHSNDSRLNNAIYCGTANTMIEMPKIFKLSKINLNITFKQIYTGIPLRVLDILGAGGFLLTNYQEEIAEHFENGHDLIFYTSIEDAIEKANYYLNHESERIAIAKNGHEKVKMFAFENMLAKIFSTANIMTMKN